MAALDNFQAIVCPSLLSAIRSAPSDFSDRLLQREALPGIDTDPDVPALHGNGSPRDSTPVLQSTPAFPPERQEYLSTKRSEWNDRHSDRELQFHARAEETLSMFCWSRRNRDGEPQAH